MSQTVSYQTLAVLVENKAGVLARVADLFARRGYNIASLTVAPTRDERFSRITIVVDVESSPLEQISKQLFKLINVVEIQELTADTAIQRELIIATLDLSDGEKSTIDDVLESYSGKVLFDAEGQITVSMESNPSKVDEFEDELDKFNIVYLQRSGRIALPKIGRSIAKHTAGFE